MNYFTRTLRNAVSKGISDAIGKAVQQAVEHCFEGDPDCVCIASSFRELWEKGKEEVRQAAAPAVTGAGFCGQCGAKVEPGSCGAKF